MKEHKEQTPPTQRPPSGGAVSHCDADVQRWSRQDRRPLRGVQWAESVERLLVDPHQGPRLVGLALVLDAAELVAELAVLPLVVVVVFGLPHRLKRPRLDKLHRDTKQRARAQIQRQAFKTRFWCF